MIPKVLILIKKSEIKDEYLYCPTGLYNSANFVKNALKKYFGIEAKVQTVIDGNSIDKAVHDYKPTHVILEAIWVTPDKIKELVKLHHRKHWIIRIHSKTPFLANEGNAIDWIKQFGWIAHRYKNLQIAFNAKETYKEFRELGIKDTVYLPNFYIPSPEAHKKIESPIFDDPTGIHIGCFGAIRPMKNQLIQAVSAIEFAKSIHKKLYFHINGERLEQGGNSVLKNIIALFNGTENELIKWPWLAHGEFVSLIKNMDLGMQVSMSESFNIVTADFVNNNVPIVVSEAVDWMPWFTRADAGEMKSIVKKLSFAHNWGWFWKAGSKLALDTYNVDSFFAWKEYFKHFFPL